MKKLSSGGIITDTIYIGIKTIVLVFDNLESCILKWVMLTLSQKWENAIIKTSY